MKKEFKNIEELFKFAKELPPGTIWKHYGNPITQEYYIEWESVE